jgi:hypothetical protein
LGHSGLENATVFRVGYAVHGQGVAVGEKGGEDTVSAA